MINLLKNNKQEENGYDDEISTINRNIVPNIQYSIYTANDKALRAVIYSGSGEEFIDTFEVTDWQDVLNCEKAKLTPGIKYRVYGLKNGSSRYELSYESTPSSFVKKEDGEIEIKESYFPGLSGYIPQTSQQNPIILKGGSDVDMEKYANSLRAQSEYAIGTLQDQITQTNSLLGDEISFKNTALQSAQDRIAQLQEQMNTIHQDYMKQITTLQNTIAQKDAEIKEANLKLENEIRFKDLEIQNLKNYNDIAMKMQKKEQEWNNQNDVGMKDMLPLLGAVLSKSQAPPVMAGMSAPPPQAQYMQNPTRQAQPTYKKFTPPTNGKSKETEMANDDNAEFI